MENRIETTTSTDLLYKIPIGVSIVLTLFFFFIDEGYYSFKWMLEPGAWIVFLIYVFILSSVQILTLGFLFKFLPSLFKEEFILPTVSASTILSVIAALFLIFYIFGN